MEKQYKLGAIYTSANNFLLKVKRASATAQVSGRDKNTAENETTGCTEHAKVGLDFAKAVSQVVFAGSQILNVCMCPGSEPLCAADL